MTTQNDGEDINLNADDTAADSSTADNNEGEAGARTGADGDEGNKEDEFKDLPFHEHPRWKQREQEWTDRLEKQKTEFDEKIATAVASALASSKPQSPKEDQLDAIAEGKIPAWFGGGKDTPEIRSMWKEYVAEQKRIITDAEKRAEDRAFERMNQGKTAEERAVADANAWFENSVTKIEAEGGKRVDRNELLKYVLDNQIIDHATKRWDYAKGYRWMMAEKASGQGGNRQTRAEIAGATMSGSGKGGEKGGGSSITTSDDFKDPQKRPW